MNNHTGYTQSNFVNALSSVKARIANILSVGVHIIESHNVMNIQNIIKAFAIDKNNISIHIFFVSFLLNCERNIRINTNAAKITPTKEKLYQYGLNVESVGIIPPLKKNEK